MTKSISDHVFKNTLGNTKIWKNKDLRYIFLTDFGEV